ncbi:HAMP domain-containing protein [Bacterioplanoides sp. SCSIO 12839]|uniref:HAMP domain-containing protein n=1 Tax=Bacterioplanoides sp. SCSIO 12839 TaxID=2829569 RepID=UPI002106F4B8|nr:HAMP domain-containing protein [Bacterioplanoides sp. SCSIO 12839]UTW49557.1 hypothetical protein KFF03_06620 [Bacterioplanoides sp. SCSIO 12839]
MTSGQHQDPPVKRRHVGLKLLSYLLGFSFIVTLITFGAILLSDYYRGINEYGNSISQIRSGYQQSISYSLWNFDTRQINSQLEGILNFPGVVYVYIESEGSLAHSAGNVLASSDERHSFPLSYQSTGNIYELGELYIDIDYTGLYQELMDKTFEILITQFLKTFSVSVFVLFIVRLLITRRLKVMSDWADSFSLNKLDQPLNLRLHQNEHDELDLVADAINEMREKLKQDVVERQQAQTLLEDTKERLALAIDNAALGFCQYHSHNDRVVCNHHFAKLMGSTQSELEQLSHPMEHLRDLVSGEMAAEQRERFNQLLYGRINRLQACLNLTDFSGQDKWVDTTIQVTRFEENLPAEILICVVDKTKEQQASRQAQELTLSLENKVAKRTEELYEEQQRTKVNIQKLSQQLERQQKNQSNCLQNPFNQLLLQYMNQGNAELLTLTQAYLDIALNGQQDTLDLSQSIKHWMTNKLPLDSIEVDQDLPLSLILEENERLIYFLLDNIILKDPVFPTCERIGLKLSLLGNYASIHISMANHQPLDSQPSAPPAATHLYEYIIGNQMQGEFKRKLTDNQLTIEFSFALIRET